VPELVTLTDPDRAHWTDPGASRPVRTTLWRPDDPGRAPLVLLSHGTGGAVADLGWLAEALTGVGYAVAGVDHHGNTSVEPYVAEAFVFAWERPRDFTVVLDALADDPGLDLTRVGAAGYSLGGYTVAGLLGARIAPQRLRRLLDDPSLAPLPEYPTLGEELTARYGPARAYAINMSACPVDVSDPRVRCGFQVAPVLGMLCDPASLARITAPVHAVWGENDSHAPGSLGALVYRDQIPGATAHGLPDTSHYDFLTSAETQSVAVREALAFFDRTLPV
jgi:predicted dienelactone hydrolase